MKRSLVIGSEGQDGTLLFDLLRHRGDEVVGIGRGRVRASFAYESAAVTLADIESVRGLIAGTRPDEIYYLAAHHHAAHQKREPTADLYRLSHAVNVDGYLNVLTAAAEAVPHAGVFYAASSHVFGRPAAWPQDESTPLAPANIYAVTKTAALHLGRFFSVEHSLRISTGILYNHESGLRKPEFVSQRIVRGAVDVAQGRRQVLELGDLLATVDWGWAPDFVDAIARIVTLDSGEYVVATGVPHTVADFAREAFAAVGLDWLEHVRGRSANVDAVPLVGDAAKLRAATGWTPSLSFEQMVRTLVRQRLDESEHV